MKPATVEAVHFLRSKQEYSDLRYWLGIVNYDPEERNFTNRVYLVYLILFFSIWFLIVLMFLASSLQRFLPLAAPMPAITVSILALLISFLGFFLGNLIRSTLRSPLIFSEDHRFLLCQQPIPSRPLVFRWIITPWLKNFLLFVLIGLMIGFFYAEAQFPAENMATHFPLYLWHGIRLVCLSLPYHIASFIAAWAAGLFACNHRGKLISWLPTLLLTALSVLILLSNLLTTAFAIKMHPLLLTFFGLGGLNFANTFGIGLILVLVALIALWVNAGKFSPSKAAIETEEAAKVGNLMRYMQFDAIKQVRHERRLKLIAKTKFNPTWQGGKAFLWKALIQKKRTFSLNDVWQPFLSFSLMLALGFAGNSTVTWMGIASWVWMLSQHSLQRLQSDLELWQLTGQISHPFERWGLIDLLLPTVPHLIAIVLGLTTGQLLFNSNPLYLLPALVFGFIAAQLQLGQDLLRKNQSDSAINGSMRSPGLRGILMAVLCILLPLILHTISPSPYNHVLAGLTALGLVITSWYGFLKQIKSFSRGQKSSLFPF